MLDKIDRALYWPQYLLAALIGLVYDEIQIRKLRRHG